MRGLFPGPLTALPRRPLSIRASTASWSIRFSLRTMISGAPIPIKRFSRLFLLMTRRYKSFKSLVANRPPSSCTIGRRSGGITGSTVRIIHSGLFPECRNASTSSKRRILRILRWLLLLSTSSFSCSSKARRSRFCKSFWIASAPICALNEPAPYSWTACWYSCSFSTCLSWSFVSPLSITI